VSASGCEIISSTCPTRLDLTENSIESVRLSNGRIIKPSLLIWSGSVRDLAELLNIPYKNLDYLSIILYCCSLEKAPRHLFQWCYYGNYDIVFNRISNPSLFDPDLVPASRHALVAEVTCREGDSLWNNPGQIQSKILHDFTKVDLIEYPDLISSIYIHKIKDAYPIYSIDYKNSLTSFMNKLYDYKNLSIGGRTGRFWYNNMDHSIEDAIQVFKKITLQR
jgi:protoporphyrinogen oxidase